MGGGYSTLFVCVCVCVCLCVCYHKIAVKFKLSQILNKLQLTNLVILDKQWFSTRQASSYRQTWCSIWVNYSLVLINYKNQLEPVQLALLVFRFSFSFRFALCLLFVLTVY